MRKTDNLPGQESSFRTAGTGEWEPASGRSSAGEEHRCNLPEVRIAGKVDLMAQYTSFSAPLRQENGWEHAHLNTQRTSEEQT